MFERFTLPARDVVVTAQQVARELHQSPIGTEHLLLGVLADEQGPVAAALRPYGLNEATVRDAISRHVGTPLPAVEPGPDRDAEDAAALKAIGIDLDAVRRAIEENFGPGALLLPYCPPPRRKRRGLLRRFGGGPAVQPVRGHIPFAPRSKKVLELSLREALRLKHNFIAPEHIVLGILREGAGLAVQILHEANVDVDRLREDLTGSLNRRAA